MEIIPAIDLKGGKCVRLRQGRDDATTIYSGDPVGVARMWAEQGASRLHLVNLDGAFGRSSGHIEILRQVTAELPALRVQYGGGLRSGESVREALEAGAFRVVLGTVAVEAHQTFREILALAGGDRCIVAVDAVDGMVAARGWTTVTAMRAADLVRRLLTDGVTEVLYTDVARDGMMGGPDLERLVELADTGMDVISSGGVASLDDVRRIIALGHRHVSGVIIGKALYERTVALPELLRLVPPRLASPGDGDIRPGR